MLALWLIEELGETQAPSSVLVSGLSDTQYNGNYLYDGDVSGRPSYVFGSYLISWSGSSWTLSGEGLTASSDSDVAYPWLATGWFYEGIDPTGIVLTEYPAPSPISNYYDLPERYLWAKIAVVAGGPREEAAYISLPKNYAWSDIYNAVAGSSGNHTDWSENVALGHIAAAYRGDTGNPANLATYIDWPWRYKVASIIDHLS
jgi:hypothetical protein